MIGCQHYRTIMSGQATEEITHGRVAQPTLCNAAISCFVAGKFPNHKAFRTSVTKHINEVDNHNIQVVLLQLRYLLNELFSCIRVVYLVIRERVFAAITLKLRPYQGFFVKVLAFFAVFVDPK